MFQKRSFILDIKPKTGGDFRFVLNVQNKIQIFDWYKRIRIITKIFDNICL